MKGLILFVFALSAAGGASTHAQDDASAETFRSRLEYRPAARIGLGWDSLANTAPSSAASCLEPTSTTTSGRDDPITRSELRLVQSKTDMMDAFDLSTSAAFRSVGFESNGSMQLAKKSSLSSTSLKVAGLVDVAMRTETLEGRTGGLRIAPDKKRLIDRGRIAKFIEQCGDSFVYQISRGGKLSVLLDVATSSDSQRRELRAKLGGSGGGATINVEALATVINDTSGTTLTGNAVAIGGVMDVVAIRSVDDVVQMMNEFPGRVSAKDSGRSMVVQSYWSLLEGADPSRPSDDAIAAARAYYRLEAAWSQMDHIWAGGLSGYDTTMSPDRVCLGVRKDDLREQLRVIDTRLKSCAAALADANGSGCGDMSVKGRATASSDCPAPPQLVPGPTHSAYDFLIFMPPPAGAVTNICMRSATVAAGKVWETWVKPFWRADCAANPDALRCLSTFERSAIDAVPIMSRSTPSNPGGSYTRSCKSCSTKRSGDDRLTLSCSCGYWEHHAWPAKDKHKFKSTTAAYSCMAPPKFANCNGTLTAGNRC